jgi:hypothetical protein
MEIELEPIEHSSGQQHHSGRRNVIYKPSDQQNTSGDTKISRKSIIKYNISKSRYSFFLTLIYINLFYIFHWKENVLFMSHIAQDECHRYPFIHKFGNHCWSTNSFCNSIRIKYVRTRNRFSISNILIINSWQL